MALQYHPVASGAISMAVTTLQTTVTGTTYTHTVRVHLRSTTVLATPNTFITDNGLEQEVVSRAGLDETTTFTTYTTVSNRDLGDYYEYVVDATVELNLSA